VPKSRAALFQKLHQFDPSFYAVTHIDRLTARILHDFFTDGTHPNTGRIWRSDWLANIARRQPVSGDFLMASEPRAGVLFMTGPINEFSCKLTKDNYERSAADFKCPRPPDG